MTPRTWRILVIDDEPENTADAQQELNEAFEDDTDIRLDISVDNDFDSGFELIRRGECDIAVLDVRREPTTSTPEDPDRGRRGFDAIARARFLPVIFWTARPNEVEDKKMPPLVDVLVKEELHLLPNAVRAAIQSGAIDVMAGIEQDVAAVMRDHMWRELAPNWLEDTLGGDTSELAHILITRVGQALQEQALPELTSRPSHCYLYPPVSTNHRPGELLRSGPLDEPSWWVILTPACDFEHDSKAEYALLGLASRLTVHPKYVAWNETRSKDRWNNLKSLLDGKLPRFVYLPKFRDIPDLALDLENTKSVPIKDLAGFDRVAVLVAPYSEALLTKHSHFRGRIGTPDLRSEVVYNRLVLDSQNDGTAGDSSTLGGL